MAARTTSPDATVTADLLSGIRVLDLSRFISGPYCTMVLGELGADIIKVESAISGDGTRKWGPDRHGTQGPDNPYFMSINRSKRSIAINLGTPAATRLLEILVRKSDVVIHNFRQDSAKKLGVSYDDIRAIKEDIVFCEVSGYGFRGPKVNQRALDFVIQADIGVMQLLGEEGDPPLKVTFPIVDICAANMAAIGIVSALIRRDRTGPGARRSAWPPSGSGKSCANWSTGPTCLTTPGSRRTRSGQSTGPSSTRSSIRSSRRRRPATGRRPCRRPACRMRPCRLCPRR
jgi:crotonobetainyl-CoA:carnitine CoA-transferase CaiB-like acyl-CoA transferase